MKQVCGRALWVQGSVSSGQQTSSEGELLGQQAVGEAGLRAHTGAAGHTRSKTLRAQQTGDRRRFGVRTIVLRGVPVGTALVADHHPEGKHR